MTRKQNTLTSSCRNALCTGFNISFLLCQHGWARAQADRAEPASIQYPSSDHGATHNACAAGGCRQEKTAAEEVVQRAGFEGVQIERGMLERLQAALSTAAAAASDKEL